MALRASPQQAAGQLRVRLVEREDRVPMPRDSSNDWCRSPNGSTMTCLELRPTALDDLGVHAALLNLAEEWGERDNNVVREVTPTVTVTISPNPTPTPPTITGERVVLTLLKHHKKGKPIGKPVVGFVFQFSTAMDPGTPGDANNYQVDWTSTKKVKKKTVTRFHPVGFSTIYNTSSDSVTLLTSATQQTFAKGGQVLVNASPPGGVGSDAGLFLGGHRFHHLHQAGRIS